MTAYYNEIDPHAAQWLRNLIDAGHIARGDVDERSIVDVRADDLRSYTQCHFFAGIGGWSVALRLAGWPDDRPVWTGSCPCQPFSAAGAGKAADDGRHMWPAWFSLVAECGPAIGWGWLDAVFSDLESEGYACGAAVLPACGVGAPHIRQRLWFVADADGWDASTEGLQRGWQHGSPIEWLAVAAGEQRHGHGHEGRRGRQPSNRGGMVHAEGEQVGLPGRARQPRATYWAQCDWVDCVDGKSRPVAPGSFPLGHGIQRRASKLRAYGNAIVPQVAAEFIGATMTLSSHTPAHSGGGTP